MIQIFNNEFEISMRILLVLKTYNKPLDIDMLTSIDLLNTYGKDFGLTDTNLHGDNSSSFAELTKRRELVINSCKSLVLKNLISPKTTPEGFKYIINNNGLNFCNEMTSDYSKEYCTEAKKIKSIISNKTESQIISYINKKSIEGCLKNE